MKVKIKRNQQLNSIILMELLTKVLLNTIFMEVKNQMYYAYHNLFHFNKYK